eukprot:2953-Heterococcus_DN1.PRE.1
MTNENAELQMRFEALLIEAASGFADLSEPECSSLTATFKQKLQYEWDHPLTDALEFVLHKRITPEQARHLLFFPTSSDLAAAYAELVAPIPSGAPPDHPQHRILVSAMTWCLLCLTSVRLASKHGQLKTFLVV